MGAGEHAGPHVQSPDFLGRATVGAGARVVDQLLGDLLLEGAEGFLGHASVLFRLLHFGVRAAFGNGKARLEHAVADFTDLLVPFGLRMDLAGLGEVSVGKALDLFDDFVGRQVEVAHALFGGATLLHELLLKLEEWLNAFFVAELDGGQHLLVGNFSGPHFDHVHTVGVTGDQEVQIGVFHLGLGGVDDEGRAIVGDDAANADGAQGALERRVGQAQSAGGAR